MGICCSCPSSNRGPMRKGVGFTPFPLLRKETLTAGSQFPVRKLTFAMPNESDVLTCGQPTTHVKVRGPNARLRARTYSVSHRSAGEFSLSVKVYSGGWVSSYLDSLNVGDVAFISATQTKSVRPGPHSGVGIIAFGVGIAECLETVVQLLTGAYDGNESLSPCSTRVLLIIANRTRDDIIYNKELSQISHQYGERLIVHHVLSRDTETGAVGASSSSSSAAASRSGREGELFGTVHSGCRLSLELLKSLVDPWAASCTHSPPATPPCFFAIGSRFMMHETYSWLRQLGYDRQLLGKPKATTLFRSTPPQSSPPSLSHHMHAD